MGSIAAEPFCRSADAAMSLLPFVSLSSFSVFAAHWTFAACARERCTVMRLLFMCRVVKRLSFAFTDWWGCPVNATVLSACLGKVRAQWVLGRTLLCVFLFAAMLPGCHFM